MAMVSCDINKQDAFTVEVKYQGAVTVAKLNIATKQFEVNTPNGRVPAGEWEGVQQMLVAERDVYIQNTTVHEVSDITAEGKMSGEVAIVEHATLISGKGGEERFFVVDRVEEIVDGHMPDGVLYLVDSNPCERPSPQVKSAQA